MLSKEEIEKVLDANVDIITYKADKDFRCLTSTEKTLLENNKKVKQYIEQLESDKQKLIEKLEEDIEEYRKSMDKTDIKLNKIHYMKRIEYAKEILEILKGENDE